MYLLFFLNTGTINFMIPKKIFQTYTSFDELHPEMKANSKKICEMHSDWEYIFFSEQDILDFITEHFGKSFVKYYEQIDPDYGSARADFFRYLVVFKYGGVYLDIKSGLNANLNNILRDDDSCILSHWPSKYANWGQYPDLQGKPEFQNWFIISEPNHPFLALAISKVVDNIINYDRHKHGVGKIGVVRTTGPIVYSKSIYKLISFCKHRIIDSDANGLTYSIYEDTKEKLAHIRRFKKHYSRMTKPIIVRKEDACKKSELSEGKNGTSYLDYRGFKITVIQNKKPLLFICSHERSGTHFLMNSISQNTDYSSVYLELDSDGKVFMDEDLSIEDGASIENYLQKLYVQKIGQKDNYFSGMIKSHYSAQHMAKFISADRVFFYIYRDPVDTLLSYWKYLIKWENSSGNGVGFGQTPLEFIGKSPTLKSQRYQYRVCDDYFSRWAHHVTDWIELSRTNENIILVRYESLKESYTPEVNKFLQVLGYKQKKFCEKPQRESFIHGADFLVKKSDEEQLKTAVMKKMSEFEGVLAKYF